MIYTIEHFLQVCSAGSATSDSLLDMTVAYSFVDIPVCDGHHLRYSGSGKSALLNALPDKEQVVPTNCMRACTAAVTRIAFQKGEIPYQAQIEHVSIAEWETELRSLVDDIEGAEC